MSVCFEKGKRLYVPLKISNNRFGVGMRQKGQRGVRERQWEATGEEREQGEENVGLEEM